jgi:5-methylcytosine-specific restriction endonuclease McrA
MSFLSEAFAFAIVGDARYGREPIPKPTSRPQRERRIERQGGLTFNQGSALVWDSRPHRCEQCGRGLRELRRHNIHHIIHRKHGGTNDPANLRLVCASCHDIHHGIKPPAEDWRDD